MKKPRRDRKMPKKLAKHIEDLLTTSSGDLVDHLERKGSTIFVKADDGFVYAVSVNKEFRS